MSVRLEDLRAIPLFRGIADAHLSELLGGFTKGVHAKGHVLFEEGDVPTRFLILTKGEVALEEAGLERLQVRAPAPLGELGALTGLTRGARAVATTEIEVLSAELTSLHGFFEGHVHVAFPFYKNLLHVVSDKMRKDQQRVDDMRGNLIRTQKAMKKLRELVLQSPETEISKSVFEVLDDLIEHNRRAHYRRAPVPSYPASVRLDSKEVVPVLELSDGFLKLGCKKSSLAKAGRAEDVVAVLILPKGEIAISGTVQREAPDGVVLKLDVLIPEYQAALEDYVLHLELLDYVV